jgi:predicted aminopeptidase
VLGDPATEGELRDRLVLVSQVRDFASELGLRVGTRYTEYAPWPGDRIVTTLVATRPGEVRPASFWFPIVGRVPYKGYFDRDMAAREAERLRADGLDVCESRVAAYSTLGWFDDPVTGPMLREPEAELVETLFHELLHATFYVSGDADWSEGAASFVGEEARVRFYEAKQGPEAGARERAKVTTRRLQRVALTTARREAAEVYAEHPPGPARDAARAEVDVRVRAAVAALAPPGEAEAWSARVRSNDACLALAATYAELTPCLDAALAARSGDLAALVLELDAAARDGDPRRPVRGLPGCEQKPG